MCRSEMVGTSGLNKPPQRVNWSLYKIFFYLTRFQSRDFPISVSVAKFMAKVSTLLKVKAISSWSVLRSVDLEYSQAFIDKYLKFLSNGVKYPVRKSDLTLQLSLVFDTFN